MPNVLFNYFLAAKALRKLPDANIVFDEFENVQQTP